MRSSTETHLVDRPYYVLYTNLVPGKYLVVVNASNGIATLGREYVVTLDPGEIETIVIDTTGNQTVEQFPPTPQSFWMLIFDDVPKTYIEALKQANMLWWYGNWTYREGDSRYNSMGLVFDVPDTDVSEETIVIKTPKMARGNYTIIIVGSLRNIYGPPNSTFEVIVDGKPTEEINVSIAVISGSITDWNDYVIIANVSFDTVDHHIIELHIIAQPYGDTAFPADFAVNRILVVPYLGYRAEVIALNTTLDPGDVYRLIENVSSGSAYLVEEVDGRVAYYPCDSVGTTPDRYPNDAFWNWVDIAVRGNSVERTLYMSGTGVGAPYAELRFSFNCPTPQCYIYAYAGVGARTAYTNAVIRLVVDGDIVDSTSQDIINGFYLFKTNVSSGSHQVVISMSAWNNYFSEWQAKTYVDHILVVKSRTITITGLKPGYIVRIVDRDSGRVVYQAMATSDTIVIDAESWGIYRFPMDAVIEVVRP